MKKVFICPMHPEIQENNPGKCPKCGMALVEKGSQGLTLQDNGGEGSYTPLGIIIGLITLVSLVTAFSAGFSFITFLSHFMTGFFLVFAGFKLIDLKGFAQGYTTYDLLAKRWYTYGYVYPFIELFFGLAMIGLFMPTLVLWLEVIVMTFSGLGVAQKLIKKETFQCACLGTFLKVPLTKVTLIENFGMAFLAIIMLVLG